MIYMLRKIFLIAVTIVLISTLVNAKTPCGRAYRDICYQGEMLDRASPPLSLSMPYEVMVAYLTIFDIHTHTDYKTFGDFLDSQQGLTDTLRSLFKSYYILEDYNPILLEKYTTSLYVDSDSVFSYKPSIFERDLKFAIQEKSPLHYLDYMLIKWQYINHLRVTDVEKYDSGWDFTYKVTSEIIDNIKGKVIPNCERLLMPKESYNPDSLPEPATLAANPGARFIFELEDENHKIATESYDEFIAFSCVSNLCIDSSNNYEHFYYNLLSVKSKSNNWLLLPISDGKVLDTNNVFGFGKNLDVDKWKRKLRERISEIKNGIHPTGVVERRVSENRLNIYPNPASDRIAITAKVENGSIVQLTINNYLGKKMFVLKNSNYNANGLCQFEINANELPCGMYFCTLKTGNYTETKKFLIIR